MSCTFFFDVCVPFSVTCWSSTIQSISIRSGINWPSKRGRSSMLRAQFSNCLGKRTLTSLVVSSERLRNVPSCNWSIMAKYNWGSVFVKKMFLLNNHLKKDYFKLQGQWISLEKQLKENTSFLTHSLWKKKNCLKSIKITSSSQTVFASDSSRGRQQESYCPKTTKQGSWSQIFHSPKRRFCQADWEKSFER